MKQWTVTYRDKNGSKASVVIEAEDRAGVFAELKKRGISAISVSEGASNKKPRKAVSSSVPFKGRGLIAAAVAVLIVGIVAWCFLFRHSEKPSARSKEEKVSIGIADVKPDYKKVKPPKSTVFPAKPKPVRSKHEEYMERQRAAMAKKLGRRKVHAIVTNDLRVGRSYYKNTTEQIMLQVFGTELGDMPEPLPAIPQRDKKRIVEILLAKDEVKETDSEDVAFDKELLADAKSALAQYIKEGGNVDDFFSYYHRQLESAYRRRVDARRMIVEAARSGDVEVAKEVLEKYNKTLEADGIKPIVLPDSVFKKKGSQR